MVIKNELVICNCRARQAQIGIGCKCENVTQIISEKSGKVIRTEKKPIKGEKDVVVNFN